MTRSGLSPPPSPQQSKKRPKTVCDNDDPESSCKKPNVSDDIVNKENPVSHIIDATHTNYDITDGKFPKIYQTKDISGMKNISKSNKIQSHVIICFSSCTVSFLVSNQSIFSLYRPDSKIGISMMYVFTATKILIMTYSRLSI